MINSKLVGKTLPEIIHMIVFEEITNVNYHDGEYIESLLQGYISQDDIDETTTELEDDIERLESDLQAEKDHVEYLENLLEENGIEY